MYQKGSSKRKKERQQKKKATTFTMTTVKTNQADKIVLFVFFILHNKDYTSITLYKDVARGPQETTRPVRGGPLVTIILSYRSISTHNNGGYKTHYRYNKKSKTFVSNDCNIKIEVIELIGI